MYKKEKKKVPNCTKFTKSIEKYQNMLTIPKCIAIHLTTGKNQACPTITKCGDETRKKSKTTSQIHNNAKTKIDQR